LVKSLTNKDGDKSVNPDEAVAMGAAIQGGVLAGEVKDVLLLDVTPLSLGIETLGGVFTQLIERNTTIPTKKSQVFSTAADNQTAVTIRAFQGERAMAADNKLLGQFDLIGIPPAPRGIPQVEVSFDIDANGIVAVNAKDLGTGKEQSIKITASTNLSKDEVERMRQEASKHESVDKEKRESIETLNQADTLVYSAENLFKDIEGKVDSTKVDQVKQSVEELKKLLEPTEKDLKAIKEKLESTQKQIQELSVEMYQKVAQEQAAQEPGSEAAKEGKDEKVVDADFEEVKDEKKDDKPKDAKEKK
ncbi:Hsp70 family protein, partial [Candidatus Woesearchaeota archaeon]|nr:Hsp70 family protein [Candidatus Woesearchaeota archaeon]